MKVFCKGTVVAFIPEANRINFGDVDRCVTDRITNGRIVVVGHDL